MNTIKDKIGEDFDETLTPRDGHKLSKENKELIEEHGRFLHRTRSPERIIKNQMLSVLYRLEEYLQTEDSDVNEVYSIEYFVNEFCKVLKLNKTQFANYLDTDVSNLNKYLKGQRVFNKELAMKFSRFFNTPVDVWLKVQLKNDLIVLHEEEKGHQYDKYDYRKVLKIA